MDEILYAVRASKIIPVTKFSQLPSLKSQTSASSAEKKEDALLHAQKKWIYIFQY